jgi:lipopolysaccharide export system permease protein
MTKLIDRLLCTEIAPAFVVLALAITGFVWIGAGPVLLAAHYLAEGVPLFIVLELVGLYLPPMVVLTFPMAIMFAVILAFVRLSEGSEAVALFAAGVSFSRLLVAPAVLGLVVTILGLYVNNTAVPAANRRIENLRANLDKEVGETTRPCLFPPHYQDRNLLAVAACAGGYDLAEKALKKVTIVELNPDTGVPVATIHGESATWNGGTNWVLNDVVLDRSDPTGREHMHLHSAAATDITVTPANAEFLQRDPDSLSFRELDRQITAMKKAGMGDVQEVRDAEVDLWGKLALPCSCVIFALVGAPLGLRTQRGSGRNMALLMGVGIILFYYALYKYMEILGGSGHFSPALAAFIPNLVGIVLGAVLILRAPQ